MWLYDARLPNLKAFFIVELAKTKLGIAMNGSYREGDILSMLVMLVKFFFQFFFAKFFNKV